MICRDEQEKVEGILFLDLLSTENAKERHKHAEVKAGISKCGHAVSVNQNWVLIVWDPGKSWSLPGSIPHRNQTMCYSCSDNSSWREHTEVTHLWFFIFKGRIGTIPSWTAYGTLLDFSYFILHLIIQRRASEWASGQGDDLANGKSVVSLGNITLYCLHLEWCQWAVSSWHAWRRVPIYSLGHVTANDTDCVHYLLLKTRHGL